jgi:hypothetical protein
LNAPLHILHLEDDPNDAVLIESTLTAGGIACVITRVESRDDFVAPRETSFASEGRCTISKKCLIFRINLNRMRWRRTPSSRMHGLG